MDRNVTVLEGYCGIVINGQEFLVPDYAVPDLRIKLSAEAKRKESGAGANTTKTQGQTESGPGVKTERGSGRAPPDPALSKGELLALDAEVKALQAKSGMSYKDSARALYLSEMARIEALDRAEEAFSAIRQRCDDAIEHFGTAISQIDKMGV